MSDWTVHLELVEGTSSKFWRARLEGKTLYVNYGKIGASGQTQVKDFADAGAARAEYDKLVREKRKKGYHDAGSAPADEPEPDEPDSDEEDDDAPPPKKPARAAKPAAPAAPPPAASMSPGHRMVLDAGGRKVETTLYLEGNTMRMDSRETYASSDAARKAFDRLKKLLGGEGYKDA